MRPNWPLLASKMGWGKRAMSQGMQAAPRNRKSKTMDSLLEPLERNSAVLTPP